LIRIAFVRFLIVGAVNTLVGYGLFCAFLYLGLASLIALTLATVLGVCFNFFSTGRIVFGHKDPSRFRRFVLLYVVYFAVNAGLLESARAFGLSAYAAQALVMPPLVIALYLGQRRFVFGPPAENQFKKAPS